MLSWFSVLEIDLLLVKIIKTEYLINICHPQVESPDKTGREAILKVHVSKKGLPLGEDVVLSDIASMTPGFTG